MKQAGQDVENWYKKFAKKHEIKGSKHANRKFHKQWKRINKWMSTLKKNDTDGDQKSGIPFVPVMTHKTKEWAKKGKQKALKVFEKLQKMWKLEDKSKRPSEMPLFGRDEKEIQPKFLESLHLPFTGGEEKSIQNLDDKKEVKPVKKVSFIDAKLLKGIKKEADEMVKKAEEVLPMFNEEKEKLRKLYKSSGSKSVSPEEVFKEAKATAEEWGKSPDSILKKNFTADAEGNAEKRMFEEIKLDHVMPFPWGNKWMKPMQKTGAQKEVEHNMDTKKKLESSANEFPLSLESVNFEEAKKQVIKETKLFEEAEKKWEEEMKKKQEEKMEKKGEIFSKTTKEQEIEEELKQPEDLTFTPPIDEDWPTMAPETMEGTGNQEPSALFKFEEEDSFFKKKPSKEILRKAPTEVYEQSSLFEDSSPSQGFDKISPEAKPFFKDIEPQQKYEKETKQWKKIVAFMNSEPFKNMKNKESKKASKERKEEAAEESSSFFKE